MYIKKDRQIFIFNDDNEIVEYDIIEDKILRGDKYENKLLCMSIDESEQYFEDENIWFMFRDIGKKEGCRNINDVIYNLHNYKNFEQIYSAGLKVHMTPSPYGYNGDFDYTIKEIPKGLRKICKEHNMYLDNRMVVSYMRNPDIYNSIFFMKETYKGLKKTNLKTITEYRMRGNILLLPYLNDHYNYNIRDLVKYFDYVKTDLKIRNMKNILDQYSDYVQKAIAVGNDFEKYPKDFVGAHDMMINEYNKIRDEEKDKKQYEYLKQRKLNEKLYFDKNVKHEYEIEYKDYIFIYPKSAEEIRAEGKNNHNCVATYINSVISGHCDILFLRKKDAPKKSLVTLEVRDGRIVQARRVCNSLITDEDKEAIRYFNSMFSGQCEFIDNNEEFENLD